MLTLIVANPCPFCDKVVNYIQKSNIADVVIVDTEWDPSEHDRLRREYGKTQVPLLLIDNQPLYESDAIIDYLRRRTPS
jgi:glutaredoxin 3